MVNASTGPLDLLRFGTFLLELVSSSGVLSKKPLQNFVAIGGDAGDAGDGGGNIDIGLKAETSFPTAAPRERKRAIPFGDLRNISPRRQTVLPTTQRRTDESWPGQSSSVFEALPYLTLRCPLATSAWRAGIAHERRLNDPAGLMMISQGLNSSKMTLPNSSKSTSKELPCNDTVPHSLTDPVMISHSSVIAPAAQALLNSSPKTKLAVPVARPL